MQMFCILKHGTIVLIQGSALQDGQHEIPQSDGSDVMTSFWHQLLAMSSTPTQLDSDRCLMSPSNGSNHVHAAAIPLTPAAQQYMSILRCDVTI